jgi:hypothetical protein
MRRKIKSLIAKAYNRLFRKKARGTIQGEIFKRQSHGWSMSNENAIRTYEK